MKKLLNKQFINSFYAFMRMFSICSFLSSHAFIYMTKEWRYSDTLNVNYNRCSEMLKSLWDSDDNTKEIQQSRLTPTRKIFVYMYHTLQVCLNWCGISLTYKWILFYRASKKYYHHCWTMITLLIPNLLANVIRIYIKCL